MIADAQRPPRSHSQITPHSPSMSESPLVLIVDDDAAVCWALRQVLEQAEYRVAVAADAAAGRRAVRKLAPDLVLTDIRMPGASGLDLLADLRIQHPHVPVVVMTAHGTMETAIEAVGRGAFDYLPKPLDLDRTLDVVRRGLGEQSLAAAAQPTTAPADTAIVGSTPAMQEVYRRIAAAAATDMGVLVTGPSGSGKELVARALHRHSKRKDGPFVAVNCGALPEHLVESELFGHEAGAFTDARSRTIGRIHSADGGTLFLDEVGELPLAAQVKLLRFLEDQRFTRVGGNDEIQVDVRIIAATNRDLATHITAKLFREDLAYRLRVVTIALPPLVDRLDDLPALVRHVLARTAARLDRGVAITDDGMAALRRHSWPGNVRELKHVLEEAAVLATGGIISPEHLSLPNPDGVPAHAGTGLRQAIAAAAQRLVAQDPGNVWKRLEDEVQDALIREALARTAGNQLRAAELLGINRITLKKRMDELAISR